MIPSVVLSMLLTCSTALLFLVFTPDVRHWFILPVIGCGILIGIDAIDWVRGRLALFDPAGLIGVLGVHIFFLCPILNVVWDHRMKYLPDQPLDYRPWLGLLAVILLISLLAYRLARRLFRGRVQDGDANPIWRFHSRRFWLLLTFALLISGVLQAWVYHMLGGLSGYIRAYSAWLRGENAFQGTALLFTISESFPILFIIGFAVWSWTAPWRRQWFVIVPALLIFFLLSLIFGGLRGSRSNLIWGCFWAVGIIHLYVRPSSRKWIAAAVPLLVVFLGVYAVYKNQGSSTFHFLSSANTYEEIQSGSERAEDILLGDLGRSDVQSFLLYRFFDRARSHEYALGQTYLGALTIIVPRSLWPDRPPTKVRWTTDLEFGRGAYAARGIFSTRVYGLAGETMLNFGPLLVPLAFALLGIVVERLRTFMSGLELGDTRRLLVPFFCNFCFLLLLNDSDNQVFYLFKYGLIPSFIILAASGEYRPAPATERYTNERPSSAARLARA